VAAEPSAKEKAWVIFDRIVALAAPDGVHSNPLVMRQDGSLCFEPDFNTLVRLLGVPLHLRAGTQSGVPALALDVWLSYELRRAGFNADQAWPRVNEALLVEDEVTIAIQVNGKLRDTIRAARGADKADLEALAVGNDAVQRILGGAVPRKVIVVPDRLVNVVA